MDEFHQSQIDEKSRQIYSQNDLNKDMNPNEQQIRSMLKIGIPIFIVQSAQITRQKKPNSNIDQQYKKNEDKILSYNRKQKSLEELSRKFISYFQGYESKQIQFNQLTKILGVERRRIYDIINILQSLEVVVKNGKNNYKWQGLQQTINYIEKISIQSKLQNQNNKGKSLKCLASQFLRLFVHYGEPLSLENAIQLMIHDIDHCILRTKVRRLYDIVNVFKSIGLIQKVWTHKHKPAFQWLGTVYLQEMISANEKWNCKYSYTHQKPALNLISRNKQNISFSVQNTIPKLQQIGIIEDNNERIHQANCSSILIRPSKQSAFSSFKT